MRRVIEGTFDVSNLRSGPKSPEDYKFTVEGANGLDLAALETRLPEGSIEHPSGQATDRHHNLTDPSVLVSIAHDAIPALAAWLATRKGKIKVTRRKKSGDSWSFELGVGSDGVTKSTQLIQTALERD